LAPIHPPPSGRLLRSFSLAFESMQKYGLKMDPWKCAFGVTAGKFLGFVVCGDGIEVDPKRVEAIRKIKAPICKKEVQSLLGKVNYLWRIISNLAGKIESLLPLVRPKHEKEFSWGMDQQKALDHIKDYLTNAPVLRAPKLGEAFKLYIAAQDMVLGAVLTQEETSMEFVVAYARKRLVDAETRYAYMENYVYLCILLVPNFDIIYYPVIAQLHASTMSLGT
jgi:hypothetical protein